MKRIRGRRRQRERGWYLAGAVLATLLALGLLGSLQGRPAGAAAGKAKIPPAAYTGAGREEGSDGSWPLTLVNRWNPVPEGHEVELVAVEGGLVSCVTFSGAGDAPPDLMPICEAIAERWAA